MVFQRIEGYPKISDFVAIDFETATEKSPCQIGMAVVKDGVIRDCRLILSVVDA